MTDPEQSPSRVEPLEYRTPPAPQHASPKAAAVRGFVYGVIMTAVAGCFAVTTRIPRVVATTGPSANKVIYPPPQLPVAVFAALAVVSVCVALVMLRSRPRNVFYLGMAAGVGVTALCEGLCFANS